jgi:hypothetical protein
MVLWRSRWALASAALVLVVAAAAAAPSRADAPPEGGTAFETGLSFDAAVAKAKAAGKPLFVDFWSDG